MMTACTRAEIISLSIFSDVIIMYSLVCYRMPNV
jgi:hypothetical protein